MFVTGKKEWRMMCYWLLHIIFSGPCRRNVASKVCAWKNMMDATEKLICLQFKFGLAPIDLQGQNEEEVSSKTSTGFRLHCAWVYGSEKKHGLQHSNRYYLLHFDHSVCARNRNDNNEIIADVSCYVSASRLVWFSDTLPDIDLSDMKILWCYGINAKIS